MRIANRIARLEKRDNADPRMTADEIAAAAARIEGCIADGDLPPHVTAEKARASWRSLVELPVPGWRQRVYANMDPMDVYL
jgi:hypothetical protein